MSDRPKVLVREPIAEGGLEILRERFDVDVTAEGDLAEMIGGYDALIVRSATKVTRELIERAERLKVIGRAGVGVDNVDLDAATERGIIVANAPQSTVISAAEHTIGLLLALSRNIPQAHAALKEGRWERSRYGGLELAGKTLGLVGFGRIGQQVARRASGLEMRVLAYDPHVAPDRFKALGVERAGSLDEVLAEADFLSLHVSLTSETRGMIGADELAKAKQGVRLVNAARGELIDEAALAEAVRSGKVAGAALDVFSAEPYSGELLELDTVIVTPHLAASTAEAQDRAGVIVAEQVAAALDGGMVTNAVNMPSVGAEDLEALGPFMPLAADLAALACELAGGNPSRIDLIYRGRLAERDTRLLTVAALNGAFKGRVEQPVNFVNAPLAGARTGHRGARVLLHGVGGLHEPRRRDRPCGRPHVPGRGHDDRPRGAPPAGARPRLRDRRRARPLHALRRERRHARDHRPARHDPRHRAGEHREHDRVAEPAGGAGAHGALARQPRPGRGARHAGRGAGLRRGALHRPSGAVSDWPPEVERVAQTLRDARVESRIEAMDEQTATAADAAKAVGCGLAQIVKSLLFSCDDKWVLAMVPGDRRADRVKIAALVERRESLDRRPRRRVARDRLSAGRRGPVSAAGRPRGLHGADDALARPRLDRRRLAPPRRGAHARGPREGVPGAYR